MPNTSPHKFHIPVMGLAYTVDSPLKCARFGINSVVSIIEDNLIEEMRRFWCGKMLLPYKPIKKEEEDSRARRVTAYLNLLDVGLTNQMSILRNEDFEEGNDIVKYFALLPDDSSLKLAYLAMRQIKNPVQRATAANELRNQLVPGSIDVNIMTKCDRTNYSKKGEPLPVEYSDAMAALRGFANSSLESSIVFSAGVNMRLFAYCERFPDFFPDENGYIRKKIILKVSDYRSALIQGKILAKKGIWVSEYRVESGLNCGGHAFATDGLLLGPIMEEFRSKRMELENEQYALCGQAFRLKQLAAFPKQPPILISVQGGVGTAAESDFLTQYYGADSIGWGSPFLLVPEVTNVDKSTLARLSSARQEDYYLSDASPLGVLFNNLRSSSANVEKQERIENGKPGSPCYNKYLAFNTEFTEKPICTASREYQHLKIEELKKGGLDSPMLTLEIKKLTEKECICQGLGTSFFLKNNIEPPHRLKAVTICPGPNLAYFSKQVSLHEMVDHIYGRNSILNDLPRPHIFINELNLYIDFFKKELLKVNTPTSHQIKYLQLFRDNLFSGIDYYLDIAKKLTAESAQSRLLFIGGLIAAEQTLVQLEIPGTAIVTAC